MYVDIWGNGRASAKTCIYKWIWGDELLLMIHVPEWNAEASCLLAKLNFEQTPTMDVVVH